MMTRLNPSVFILAVTVLIWAPPSNACSTFLVGDAAHSVVGKSYDWHAGHGMVVANKRNVAKTAFAHASDANPAQWTSDFGSMTFTQFGQELPLGGINEAGLVVEIMWLSEAEFPSAPQKPVLNELQWIQYILDTADDIDTAIRQAEKVDIVNIYAAVHFMACDRFAECATFEYLHGVLTIHRPDQMPTQTLTNNTYRDSVEFLHLHEGFGGSNSIPTGLRSLERFVRAAHLIDNYEGQRDKRSFAFNVLNSVRSFSSQWQIVYEQQNQKIHVRLPGFIFSGSIKTIDATDVDYSCSSPVLALDLRGDTAKPAWQWTTLSYDLNFQLLNRGNRSLNGAVGEEEVQRLANYPATLRCLD